MKDRCDIPEYAVESVEWFIDSPDEKGLEWFVERSVHGSKANASFVPQLCTISLA